MAKNILGIDIGHDCLKLVLVNRTQVKKTALVSMPHNLMRGGRVVSVEAMAELIRNTMKENGIKCRNAALVLPYETAELLKQQESEENEPEERTAEARRTMDLFAVAAPISLLEESKDMLRKAGLKMVKAAPAVCSYMALIRNMEKNEKVYGREYGFVDLGYSSVRMYIFKGDCHMASHILEVSLSSLDETIAEEYHIDVHLTRTYLLANHDDCQNKEQCINAFEVIAVELMKKVYRHQERTPACLQTLSGQTHDQPG